MPDKKDTSDRGFLQIVECPRDAMQGWPHYIPAGQKANYINQLLQVGFHTLDFGSFVSPKAIPQMKDTREVLSLLNLADTKTKLLAIVANIRGAEEAASFPQIEYLGFPLSVSPTFQLRNTNATIAESLHTVTAIQEICLRHNKTLVVYLSMGFGNPYGDEYNKDILLRFTDEMAQKNISILSLSDTVGVANPDQIRAAFATLIPAYPQITFGAHLHTTKTNWDDKLKAAVEAGCRRFDGAIGGVGGCPMAQDELIGNMPTEKMISYLQKEGFPLSLDQKKMELCIEKSKKLFS